MKKFRIRCMKFGFSFVLSATLVFSSMSPALAAELPASTNETTADIAAETGINTSTDTAALSEISLTLKSSPDCKSIESALEDYLSEAFSGDIKDAYPSVQKLTLKSEDAYQIYTLTKDDCDFILEKLTGLTTLNFKDITFKDDDIADYLSSHLSDTVKFDCSYTPMLLDEPSANDSDNSSSDIKPVENNAIYEDNSDNNTDSNGDSDLSAIEKSTETFDQISSDATAVESKAAIDLSVNVRERRYADITFIDENIDSASSVVFPVWGSVNGQNDIRWYEAKNNGNHTWTATVDLANHKEIGTYNVHVYTGSNINNRHFTKAGSFNVENKTSANISIINQDNDAGTFRVKISNISTPCGYSDIVVPIWADINGQNDIIWYKPVKEGNDYYVDIDTANHQFESGIYNIHVYITNTIKGLTFAGSTKATVTQTSSPKLSFTTDSSQSKLTISLRHYKSSANSVSFPVWGAANGQNDLKWYTATKKSNGTYETTIDITSHKEFGTYYVHAYDGSKFITGTTTNIDGIFQNAKIEVVDKNEDDGTCKLKIGNVTSPAKITKVDVPIWSQKNGQDDIHWYSASWGSDGNWYVTFDIHDHNTDIGTYDIHVYAQDTRGCYQFAGKTTVNFEKAPVIKNPTVTVTMNSNGSTATVTVNNVSNASEVKVPVWGSANGQNDLIWYDAKKINSTTWQATIDFTNHMETGTYYVHVYTLDANKNLKFACSTTCTLNKLPSNILTFSNVDNTYGKFTATIANAYTGKNISNVSFAVWTSKNEQDDIHWVNSTKSGNNWIVNLTSDDHNYESGTYNVHVYANNSDGTLTFLAANTISITRTVIRTYQNPAGYYQIKDSISIGSGGYNLSYGYEGLKVKKVVQYFGINNGVGMGAAYYGSRTQSAVTNFQRRNGLPATGVVDLATWRKMGFTDYDWYNLGAYVHPKLVSQSGSRSEHIEAMIKAAYEYLGNPYVIGASGAPSGSNGVDCSGLAMQALYAAGLDMETITPVTHAMPGHEYESRNMWASSKFLHVSYANRQRGDLIFYQNSAGTVIHVAIYLGNNLIIDSWPNKVAVVSVTSRGRIKGVVRPFI